jgi:hypothetical protein
LGRAIEDRRAEEQYEDTLMAVDPGNQNQKNRSRSTFSDWLFRFVFIGVILLIATPLIMIPGCALLKELRRLSQAQKLKAIGLAMSNYSRAYNCFPVHPAGGSAALYQLKSIGYDEPFLFDIPLRGSYDEVRAQWDEVNRRLVGGNISYANLPRTKNYADRIQVVTSRFFDSDGRPKCWGIYFSGAIEILATPTAHVERLLGAYELDGVFLANEEVADEWAKLRGLETAVYDGPPPPNQLKKFNDETDWKRQVLCTITMSTGEKVRRKLHLEDGIVVKIEESPP